jgi:hypothetical protein
VPRRGARGPARANLKAATPDPALNRSLLAADEAALWSQHTNETGNPLKCLYVRTLKSDSESVGSPSSADGAQR